jgi:putative nucleotidyltransferase with HDIG domain
MKKDKDQLTIKKVRAFVEEECKKPTNIFGHEIFTCHITLVVKYAKMLAKKCKADQDIVELAALLHDIAAIQDQNNRENHHISGAKEAERILKELKYPDDKIERVKHCVFSHRASKSIKRETIEAECVASADAMAHFNSVPQLFGSALIRLKMSPEESKEWISAKLERSWKKLTPEAKKITQDKYSAAKTLLKN